MSRIRQINPHLLHSASMAKVSRDAQLTFIRLWLVADDAGRAADRLVDTPTELQALRGLPLKLYPGQTDVYPLVEGWLDELERVGCIVRYTVDGRRYVRVVNWRKHQKISHPTKSRLPAEPATPDALARSSGATRESLVPTDVRAASLNNSTAILANSGATREPLAKEHDEAAHGGQLGGFRERLMRIF